MDDATISPRLRELALDLRNAFPRSPREKLAGYVIAPRTLDKCRAIILGQNGDYNFGRLLDSYFLDYIEVSAETFRAAVAEGRTDAEMESWILENAPKRATGEIVAWNNKMRDLQLSELPERAQVFMEAYIPEHMPSGRVVYRWFDVYDLEEGRI